MRYLLTLAFTFIFQTLSFAQGFSVGGTVKNAKGEPLASATVFIAGSQKATYTGVNGEFIFMHLPPGTYEVVVNMLGYSPLKQNVVVKDADVPLHLVMTEKAIALAQVNIGAKSNAEHFKVFVKKFMGESENARSCKILNHHIIDFSTDKTVLNAATDEFLEIENHNLGYKIKYLLRSFQYDKQQNITYYDGVSFFEPMTGTPKQQQKWEENRRKAFLGSLMHYLRSLYDSTAVKQGFITYESLNVMISPQLPLYIKKTTIAPSRLIKRIDSSFVSFAHKGYLYVDFGRPTAVDPGKVVMDRAYVSVDPSSTGSLLRIEGLIDERGNYTAADAALVMGYWSKMRIGDRLPMEYVYEKPTKM